jgi:uncharacterized protein DUF4145
MASLNAEGSVTAGCTRCKGVLSTFEWHSHERPYGVVTETFEGQAYTTMRREFRLFRCDGCGRGGLGSITLPNNDKYPSSYARLERFTPNAWISAPLPKDASRDIQAEFQEGEACLQFGCNRAAAAMFRSALEKTLTAAGYKVDRHTKLYDQIEAAAADGSITDARKHRAHEEIRVLGNDVLHDAWKALEPDEAVLARDYTQRVIEDFYDHRASVLARLREKKRVPAEDQKKEEAK